MKIGGRDWDLWFGKCVSPSLPKTSLRLSFGGSLFQHLRNSLDSSLDSG